MQQIFNLTHETNGFPRISAIHIDKTDFLDILDQTFKVATKCRRYDRNQIVGDWIAPAREVQGCPMLLPIGQVV